MMFRPTIRVMMILALIHVTLARVVIETIARGVRVSRIRVLPHGMMSPTGNRERQREAHFLNLRGPASLSSDAAFAAGATDCTSWS